MSSLMSENCRDGFGRGEPGGHKRFSSPFCLSLFQPGFQEWVEKTNAHFAEVEKHELTVEED